MNRPKINTELLRESLEITNWTSSAVDYIVNAVEKHESYKQKEGEPYETFNEGN